VGNYFLKDVCLPPFIVEGDSYLKYSSLLVGVIEDRLNYKSSIVSPSKKEIKFHNLVYSQIDNSLSLIGDKLSHQKSYVVNFESMSESITKLNEIKNKFKGFCINVKKPACVKRKCNSLYIKSDLNKKEVNNFVNLSLKSLKYDCGFDVKRRYWLNYLMFLLFI